MTGSRHSRRYHGPGRRGQVATQSRRHELDAALPCGPPGELRRPGEAAEEAEEAEEAAAAEELLLGCI